MPVSERLTQDHFQARFLEEYYLESPREQKAIEFETLTYGSCGSVDAYAQKFVELCVYTPSLVATDRLRVRQLIRGLPLNMQKVLLGQGNLSFVEVVNRARQFERIDGGQLEMDVEGSSK